MIELWDGYTITADDYNFILGKPYTRTHKSRNKDEQRIEGATYYATLAQALAAFHTEQLRKYIKSEVQTLAQASAASAQIENRIRLLITEPNFKISASHYQQTQEIRTAGRE